jgi:integrating conjugative element protein (TIGR03752 family)
MQIKSNTVVKFIVPAVIVAGLVVGLKSCKEEKPKESAPADVTTALKNLSPDELKALGVEGDTPEDTLRTLIGRLNDVRDRQKILDKQNADLLKENEQLRKHGTNISGQVDQAVQGLRSDYDKRQQQLQDEQTSLLAKVQALSEQLKTTGSAGGKQGSDSDIPLGLGLDGLGGNPGSSATRGNDGLMWVTPTDQKEPDPRDAAQGKAPTFPTSFLDDNPLTRQKAAYEQQVKGYTNEKGAQDSAEPAYTLPENSTLVGRPGDDSVVGANPNQWHCDRSISVQGFDR